MARCVLKCHGYSQFAHEKGCILHLTQSIVEASTCLPLPPADPAQVGAGEHAVFKALAVFACRPHTAS